MVKVKDDPLVRPAHYPGLQPSPPNDGVSLQATSFLLSKQTIFTQISHNRKNLTEIRPLSDVGLAGKA
jgi:hypothetical protein